MTYDNFTVEQIAAKLAENQTEGLTVSYDSLGERFVSNFLSGFGNTGFDTGDYNDGTNVYVYGNTDALVDFSTGNYGTALNIDASASSSKNFLVGNAAPNIIVGGTYSNMMWGGLDYANDILVGGTGYNFFATGKNEGNDVILNASLTDTVYLQDVSLSDIVATASDGNTVGILFNTGNVLTVSSPETSETNHSSAFFVLADNTTWRYLYSQQVWVH